MADTIVACATARGTAAIAVIRISGTLSHAIATEVSGTLTPPRLATVVRLRDAAGQTIDQAIQLIFHAPASFTGEDMVEWHCHGGQLVVDLLLKRALALGAHPAQPGEFSKRAFLNDKIDLSQAEAIAELIHADSRTVAQLAAKSLAGGLTKPLGPLVDRLDWCRTQTEARLDFSDEPIEPARLAELADQLQDLESHILRLAERAEQNLAVSHVQLVTLIGAPNTGKSSLFNQLLGESRALVSDQPGTTRDLLREQLECGDTRIQLCDSAGIHQSDDSVEQAGIELATAAIRNTDLLLILCDSNAPPPTRLWRMVQTQIAARPEDLPPIRICVVCNKIDLHQGKPTSTSIELEGNRLDAIYLCATTGEGMDLLRAWLLAHTGNATEPTDQDAFLVRHRHLEALEATAELLRQAAALLEDDARLEIVAELLRLARQKVGELTGQTASDDLLGMIFSRFCIGK